MEKIFLKQLTPNDGYDCYQLLQRIGEKENDFTNPVHNMNYDEYKKWLIEQDNWSKGRELPQGYVPQHCFWLIVDDTPVGFGKIRTGLTEKSRLEGGNLGYAISPDCRGKGYGTKLLEFLIKKAKELNLEKPLVTVKKYNYPSKKVAENNGGVLINETGGWWYYEIQI